MKNEWDMFAAVHEQLAAGEKIVKIYLTTPADARVAGQLGGALDENGETYHLGEQFQEALQQCIRERRISWKIHHGSKTLAFGPGLNTTPDEVILPGEKTINLLDGSVDLLDLFGSDEEEDDDTWWRPKP